MEISIQQALQNLYNASREAKLTAEEHVIIQNSYKILKDFILSLEQAKKSTENVVEEN